MVAATWLAVVAVGYTVTWVLAWAFAGPKLSDGDRDVRAAR